MGNKRNREKNSNQPNLFDNNKKGEDYLGPSDIQQEDEKEMLSTTRSAAQVEEFHGVDYYKQSKSKVPIITDSIKPEYLDNCQDANKKIDVPFTIRVAGNNEDDNYSENEQSELKGLEIDKSKDRLFSSPVDKDFGSSVDNKKVIEKGTDEYKLSHSTTSSCQTNENHRSQSFVEKFACFFTGKNRKSGNNPISNDKNIYKSRSDNKQDIISDRKAHNSLLNNDLEEKKLQEKHRYEAKRQEREEVVRVRREQEKKNCEEKENLLFKMSTEISCSSDKDIYFSLYSEKKEGLGEDSMPLIFKSDNVSCVGVFDGMGGAGATMYPTYTLGLRTGAYLASRIVRAFSIIWLNSENGIGDIQEFIENISIGLNNFLGFWKIPSSGLRSSVIRVLPTTLAIIEAKQSKDAIEIHSYWAGDSRNYILLSSGLRQVSTDDLRQPKDPLDNLRNDDALSNCVCQDRPFKINERYCGTFSEPVIILSATDGCYGYLLTPMHFEYIILDGLMRASNCEEWRENIRELLSPISSDDFTIGLQMIGGDFHYWKDALVKRFEFLKKQVIEPIEKLKSAYEDSVKECHLSEEKLKNLITSQWNDYKNEYIKPN